MSQLISPVAAFFFITASDLIVPILCPLEIVNGSGFNSVITFFVGTS
jgi:hypothetical protein